MSDDLQNNNLENNEAELDSATLAKLAFLKEEVIVPKNSNLETNLWKRLENLNKIAEEQKESISVEQITAPEPVALLPEPQLGGFWVKLFKMQSIAVMSIAMLLCVTTGAFASYFAFPTVRETIDKQLALKSYGTLAIQTSESGAKVIINGEQMGVTPFIKDLPVGNYTLKLQLEKYEEINQSIEIKAKDRLDLDLPLLLSAPDFSKDYLVYNNSGLGLGFKYPADYKIAELDKIISLNSQSTQADHNVSIKVIFAADSVSSDTDTNLNKVASIPLPQSNISLGVDLKQNYEIAIFTPTGLAANSNVQELKYTSESDAQKLTQFFTELLKQNPEYLVFNIQEVGSSTLKSIQFGQPGTTNIEFSAQAKVMKFSSNKETTAKEFLTDINILKSTVFDPRAAQTSIYLSEPFKNVQTNSNAESAVVFQSGANIDKRTYTVRNIQNNKTIVEQAQLMGQSTDSSMILFEDQYSRYYLQNVTTGEKLRLNQQSVESLIAGQIDTLSFPDRAFSENNRYLAYINNQNGLQILDLNSGRVVSLDKDNQSIKNVNPKLLSWFFDNSKLIVFIDNSFLIYDLQSTTETVLNPLTDINTNTNPILNQVKPENILIVSANQVLISNNNQLNILEFNQNFSAVSNFFKLTDISDQNLQLKWSKIQAGTTYVQLTDTLYLKIGTDNQGKQSILILDYPNSLNFASTIPGKNDQILLVNPKTNSYYFFNFATRTIQELA